MNKLFSILLLSAVTFLATSCAVKGPLYLPEVSSEEKRE